MKVDSPRSIKCIVTFLSASDGGRTTPLFGPLTDCRYRPHFVIGDPAQREAIVVNNELQEQYLGVVFINSPDEILVGKPLRVKVALIYPEVDYSALVTGAKFTIREGAHIVGFGVVFDDSPKQN